MHRFALLTCIALALPAVAQTQSHPRTDTQHVAEPPALTLELKRITFQEVWETMRDHYYDRTFNGLDWEAVRDEYQPKALAASDHIEFHAVLNEMVKRPGVSHLAVIPPRVPGAPAGARLSAVGITLVAGGERALIAAVEPGSAADSAGLVPGDEILAVDGTDIRRIIEEFAATLPPGQQALAGSRSWLAVHQQLRGVPGSEVSLSVRSDDGQQVMRLTRALSQTHGALVRPSFRFLDRRTGLLTLTTFHADLDELLRQAFTDCGSCSAMIIDLRGNSGGFAHTS